MDLPSTRYYGSKRRIVEKIWIALLEEHIEFDSFLDLFGGTGIVSYLMLKKGKKVYYNDVLRFNCLNAKALLATPKNTFTNYDAQSILVPIEGDIYEHIIARNFHGIYFKDEENQIIDVAIQNILRLDDKLQCCGYYVLNQACLVKRPYNIFHRNNLYLRLNHTTSRFGNYITWEKSFQTLFDQFTNELNNYQFETNKDITISNNSALDCKQKADVVYIDPPYFCESSSISYHARYHFLEGLANYNLIEQKIDWQKKNKEIQINKNKEFEQKSMFLQQLSQLFIQHRQSIIVMSYTSNGYPSIEDLVCLLSQFKRQVTIKSLGHVAFAMNRNNMNREEVLIIGKN